MSEEAHSYVLRVRPAARKDIQDAYDRLAEFPDAELANRWYDGLVELFAEVATYPGRYAAARESKLFREDVHVVLHSLSSRSAVYRVLYTIEEANDDAPTVQMLGVRYASCRPMTRAEAREIEDE